VVAARGHARPQRHGLLVIVFLFPVPLGVAGAVLAYCFFSLFRAYRNGKLAGATQAEARS
jgi:hypothetical protein